MPLVGGFRCLELALYGIRELSELAQQLLGNDLDIEWRTLFQMRQSGQRVGDNQEGQHPLHARHLRVHRQHRRVQLSDNTEGGVVHLRSELKWEILMALLGHSDTV